MTRNWLLVGLAVVLIVSAMGWSPRAAAADCAVLIVDTSSGPVCGFVEAETPGIRAYLGIPYAESTAGDNRWASPVPVARSDATIEGTAFGPICPQKQPDASTDTLSEDCLSLNVWTPARSADDKLPVMVFIHGGAFVIGSSRNPLYESNKLAARGDVVVVSLNYRLGAPGFLAGYGDLDGNYGFLDQQLALRWVHDNVAGFGGDPEKVTLFGESAGAMSVGLHLIAPGSADLFRAAIMESNPYGLAYKSMDHARAMGALLRDALSCRRDGLNCMRTKSFDEVVTAQKTDLMAIEGLLDGFSGFLTWSPVLDGDVIPVQPVETAITKPVIMGTNLNEGVLFAMAGELSGEGGVKEIGRSAYKLELDVMFPSEAVSHIEAETRYRPLDGDNTSELAHLITDYILTCANRHVMALAENDVYGYQFTHVPSYDVWPEIKLCAPAHEEVCHAFELPYVFGNPTTVVEQHPPVAHEFTAAETVLSERMMDYWTRFATTLSPNGGDGTPWPAFQANEPVRLILDETISTRTDLGANCLYWDSLGYNLPGFWERQF